MLKDKLHSFKSIFEVDFAFDLCREKEEFLQILKSSTPEKVNRFNSKGTEWDLDDISYYWFGINGEKIFISDMTGDISDLFDFLIQIANSDKNLIVAFDDEGSFSAITSIAIDECNIRFTVFDYGLTKHKKILSDIIINKRILIQQFYEIFYRLYKDTLKETYSRIEYTQKKLKKCLNELSKYLQVE